ncbi:MAG: calcium-binding protein, partial [Ramlibacter sp.]
MAQTIVGTEGNDSLVGSDGNDALYGYAGNDTLQAGAGDDTLYGGAGNDSLQGGAGQDIFVPVFFSLGDDTLDGGDGDDYFDDEYGNNQFIGGAGPDHFAVHGEAGASQVARGDAGVDLYAIYAGYEARSYAVTDFQAGAGGDQLEVAELLIYDSYAYGYGGTNPFDPAQPFLRFTQSGADTLLQWDPDGTAHSAFGWITQVVLRDVSAAALTTANLVGAIPVDGSAMPVHSLTGTDDSENLIGGVFDDHITGQAGNDYLVGFGGRDLVEGGAGNDILTGDLGNDTLLGGTGDDSLDGGKGDNHLEGGDGADRFHLGEGVSNSFADVSTAGTTSVLGGAGADIVDIFKPSSGTAHSWADFDAQGGDKISVESLLEMSAGLGYTGGDPFAAAAGFLRITQQGTDALVQWDPDGAAGTARGWLTALVLSNTAASSVSPSNILGVSSDDLVSGTAGNDVLEGGLGQDTLLGEAGNDSLDGGLGNDLLQGGDGNDQLSDNYGNNTLVGGAGSDT